MGKTFNTGYLQNIIQYDGSNNIILPSLIGTGTRMVVAAANGTLSSQTASTTNIAEGTNLYYTDTRVGTYLSANTYATQSYVTTAIANLVDASPVTLDTLNELAAALGDDPNFATTIATSIGTKLPSSSVSGTTNYLPKFTGTSTIGNSIVQDNSTHIDIGGYALFTRAGKQTIINPNVGASNVVADFGVGSGMGLTFTTDVERMRLTASGNLGLGVTPSAWGFGKAIEVGYLGTAIWSPSADNLQISNNAYYDSGWKYAASAAATSFGQVAGQFRWNVAPSGTAGNAISFTQAMTLNASGNLSVGNTNDTYKLDVSGTGRFSVSSGLNLILEKSTGAYLSFQNGATIRGSINGNNGTDGLNLNYGASHTTALAIASTGAATFSDTLTASGIIYANGGINMGSNAVKMRWSNNNTPTLGFPFGDYGTALHIEVSDNDTGGLVISNDGTTVYGAGDSGFVFRVIDEDSYQGNNNIEATTCFKVNQGAGGGGYIKGDFTATGDIIAYSDIRVKENIKPLTSALSKVLELNGYYYNRTDLKDKSTKIGFIAQEVQSVIPELVTYDSLQDRYAVSYGNATALLVEAIKEQQTQIQELKELLNQFIK